MALNTNTIFPTSANYLSVNEQDQLWGLTITSVGFQEIKPGENYPPIGHPIGYSFLPEIGRILDDFQLVYIIKGEGELTTQSFEKERLRPGTIFMLHPDEWHTYKPNENTGWEVWWVGFNGTIAENMIREHFFEKSKPVFKVGFNDELVKLFNRILTISNEGNIGFQQLTASMVILILGHLIYSIRNAYFTDKDIINKINRAKTIMSENLQLSPEEVAKSLNISYSWFRKIFKQYTGMAPIQYSIQQKIYKSKELLVSTNKTIKEIADLLHFDSTYYLSTCFKNKTGMSPTEFRSKYLI